MHKLCILVKLGIISLLLQACTQEVFVKNEDFDGDGFGENYGDCDDEDANVNPDAEELCDEIDNNCDGKVNNNPVNGSTWYADADGDAFGNPSDSIVACDQPTGYVDNGQDCNDLDADDAPGKYEFCDGFDNDCDGAIDEEDAIDALIWYQDTDNDGFGDAGNTVIACTQPVGAENNAQDCVDSDVNIHPGATEVCNGLDDNCDGAIDEAGALGMSTWYLDADADGYGDVGNTINSCDQPTGYVSNDQDCNDSDAGILPGATEMCNLIDDDCDGNIDDNAVDMEIWYADMDNDSYGGVSYATLSCTQPLGYVSNDQDCNDLVFSAHPGATEVCDNVDNDCDGTIDVNAVDAATWYADTDNDGYGDLRYPAISCTQPNGVGFFYVSDATDCDDSNVNVYPTADELCNSIDDDCDGATDEADALDATVWYADTDGDLYGDVGNTTLDCTVPTGYLADATDCDDSNVNTYPGADEYCNGVDDNCDGNIDEAVVDPSTLYEDTDGDGFGDAASTIQACGLITGYAVNNGDCDDTDSTTYPGAPEIWYDGINQNCDSLSDYDADGDGTDLWSDGRGSDCNDYDAQINTAAAEACNGLDDDCDGRVDEDWAVGAECTYDDNDGDGYGSSNEDCNDANPAINPGAVELCDDGIDNDCSGVADGLDGIELCY